MEEKRSTEFIIVLYETREGEGESEGGGKVGLIFCVWCLIKSERD